MYGYCLDDPVNLADSLGVKGVVPKLTPDERKFINGKAIDWGKTMKQYKNVPHSFQTPLEFILKTILYEHDGRDIVIPKIRSMR